MRISSKVKLPDLKPKERLNIKSLMHAKLAKFSSAGLLKGGMSNKFKGPKLKIPRLKG